MMSFGGHASWTKRTLPGGKLAALGCHQTIKGNRAKELTFLSTNIAPQSYIVMFSVILLDVIMLTVILQNIVMLIVILQNVDMLIVILQNAITLSVIMQNVVMLSVILQNVILLSVIMQNVLLSVNMLTVVAPNFDEIFH
jgi:hypothetical protein